MDRNRKYTLAYIFIIGLVLFAGLSGSKSSEKDKEAYISKHVIKKDSFQGRYPFTVDRVQVHKIVCNKRFGYTGVKVIINGETYALTRNLSDVLEKAKSGDKTYDPSLSDVYLEFLPSKYWENGKKVNGKCVEVMTDNVSCKASLADVIEYAETLETEN